MINDPEYRRRKRLAGGADLVEDDFRSMMRMNHSVCPSHPGDPNWYLRHNAELKAGKEIDKEKRRS